MTVTDEANQLRINIVRLGKAHGRRYPPGMKQLILAFVERAKDAGMSVSDCCRRLGLSAKQLSMWRGELRAAEPKALVPVRVVDEAPWSTLSVVAPNGYRIEGLSTAQAIEVMRELA